MNAERRVQRQGDLLPLGLQIGLVDVAQGKGRIGFNVAERTSRGGDQTRLLRAERAWQLADRLRDRLIAAGIIRNERKITEAVGLGVKPGRAITIVPWVRNPFGNMARPVIISA